VLEENQEKPLPQQQEALEAALNAHMEGTTQRDDILFVGMKV
jgi:serine phosphatase RsbU (regulator of sigma subunit)